MEVVPVIDLMGGVVVRARLGLRSTYAPIVTPLARTSAPADVVAGFLALSPFRTLYVADLDAIEGRGGLDETIAALSAGFPGATLWVDPGVRTAEAARAWLGRHQRAHLVLGAESLADLGPVKEMGRDPRVVLSLDFDGERFLGPEALLAAPELWPRRIIVMTLARVGSNRGPDLDRLAMIEHLAPEARIYAAGGMRDAADLRCLARAGVSGVLVATALHEGRLTAADIAACDERGHATRNKKGARAPQSYTVE
jgi:phosphoribosylformimino-5-aminoimidazole carboxamide ribotide isomerase